jgi:hypothetical protein
VVSKQFKDKVGTGGERELKFRFSEKATKFEKYPT